VAHDSEILEVLVRGVEGGMARAEAEKQWQALSAEITAEKAAKWDIIQKARTYYWLLKLQGFGFTVSEEVLAAVGVKPDLPGGQAYVWWVKAMRYGNVVVK